MVDILKLDMVEASILRGTGDLTEAAAPGAHIMVLYCRRFRSSPALSFSPGQAVNGRTFIPIKVQLRLDNSPKKRV
jgi:hypothetical protein